MPLSTERRNEIAYLCLVYKVKNEGLSNLKPNEIKRRTGNMAKELDISSSEACEFSRDLYLSLFEEAFPMSLEEGSGRDSKP